MKRLVLLTLLVCFDLAIPRLIQRIIDRGIREHDRGVVLSTTLVMLGIWFIQQAVFGAVGLTSPTNAGGGVAYFAHVGGFAFGLLTIRLWAKRRKPTPPVRAAYR